MRNPTKYLLTFAAILVLIPGSDLLAQRRKGLVEVSQQHQRHGAWFSFSLGAGNDAYRYGNETGGYHSGLTKPSFALAVGGTVNPHLRLGGELNAWVNQYTDQNGYSVTESLTGGLLVGQVYPVRDLGLYIKGGLGVSRSGADVNGGFGNGETGFAYLYGAGYEVKLARNFFLTPMVNLMYHRSSPGNRNDPTVGQGTLYERVFTMGVGLTFQPGR
jgi:hypothetical protein